MGDQVLILQLKDFRASQGEEPCIKVNTRELCTEFVYLKVSIYYICCMTSFLPEPSTIVSCDCYKQSHDMLNPNPSFFKIENKSERK